MVWRDDSTHPFAGIAEKLKRADKNIVDLNSEIGVFFEGCKYPVIPNPNTEEWQQAVNYHTHLAIPKRFSVLTGEIIHHLRSCFDHIAWHFSSEQYRIEHENAIEFPVFTEDPLTLPKAECGRYKRKIKGIRNPRVLCLIRNLQPYQRGSGAKDDPLCIVHDMDRFDKHRELTIIGGCASVAIPPGVNSEAVRALIKCSKGEVLTSAERALVGKTVKQDAIVTPQVAFAKIGKREREFVVPSLVQLFDATVKRIDMFASLI